MNQERTILVVDDESDVVTALESSLADGGYNIRQATRWTEAIAEIQEHRPDAVMLDLYLPTVQGEALLEFIRDFDASLPVVIVSSEIDPTKLEQLGQKGANGFVRKPFSEEDLFVVVEQILAEVEADRAKPAPTFEEELPVDIEPEPAPPRIEPGAGIERDRPEVDVAPARGTRARRGTKRRVQVRSYVIAFFTCLIATWLLFMAQNMLSEGFFDLDINDTREVE